jgi:hypothetical protein
MKKWQKAAMMIVKTALVLGDFEKSVSKLIATPNYILVSADVGNGEDCC